MAASKKANLGPIKKSKSIINPSFNKAGLKEDFGYMKTGAKIAADVIIPRSASDLALTLAGGKLFSVGTSAIGGIAKRGAKFVGKSYRNMSK
jgi:hypothetical protein